MAEPSTTATATAALALLLSTVLLGLDGNAVVGAFAGAVLMVLSAKNVGWASRAVYLLVSWLMGYIAAPELVAHLPISQTGVAAFLAAALVITVTLQLIERVKTMDITAWLAALIKRGGGPP